MPSRNVLKVNSSDSYYHVYARGQSRQHIFLNDEDYAVFLNLFKRYLSQEVQYDSSGRPYSHLRGQVEVLAYCLMPNHFHLLLYQHEPGAMTLLMRGIMTSYSRYFNKKHSRSGPVFESRYKASLISNDNYLQHVSRYIHLNPKGWRKYPYSSIHSYLNRRGEAWLEPEKILALFDFDAKIYETFMSDYEANKAVLDEIKHELADH